MPHPVGRVASHSIATIPGIPPSMTRIFVTLALFSLGMIVAALAAGLMMGDLYQAEEITDRLLRMATMHRLTGLAAALLAVLVNCIVVTYFIGTSRWAKEVVQTYQLDPELFRRSARLKHRTFPWTLAGMLTVVGVGALGAAGDPMAGLAEGPRWASWHWLAALLGLALVAWSYFVQWNNIHANHRVIQAIVDEVQAIREARGLAVPAAETRTS